MNPTQPRVRITPAHGGLWLIRCGACPATSIRDSLPDSHDWATRHADLHAMYRIDRENQNRAARRAAALGGANR